MNPLGLLKLANGTQTQLFKKLNIIGRAATCHFVVKHASASKEHCLIEFDEKTGAFLKDMNSLNGTFVNDQRLLPGENVQIFDGDQIQIGQDPNKLTFVQGQRPIIQSKQPGNNIAAEEIRKDKDYKISVVDYSFRDNSFSRQPPQQQQIRRSVSPVVARNPGALTIGVNAENNNNNNNANSANNFYGIRQQRNDKMESVKQELYSQNIDFNEKILIREEQIMRLESQIKLLQNENDALGEEANKVRAKNKALQLYSSDLQRQIDSLNEESRTKAAQLQELQDVDWTKKLQENNVEIKNLRSLLTNKDAEIQHLKKTLSSYFINTRDPTQNNQNLFLEHQAKELATCKKQINEYENRENECGKRWSQLLKENSEKDEKIKGLKLQLSRQIETMQSVYGEQDRKISEYNQKLMRVFEDNNQQNDAAGFLVEQMALIQEERRILAVENEELHTQIQELISDIERMKSELDNYAIIFDVSVLDLSSNRANQGNIIASLKNRIEELQDLINQTKQKESVGKLIELTELTEELEKKLERERIINDELGKQVKQLQLNDKSEKIDEQNCMDFFSALLEEKDKKIQVLLSQVEAFSIKEKQYNERIEDISQNLIHTNKNFQEFKTKNDKMSELIASQNRISSLGNPMQAQFGQIQSIPSNIINERVSENIFSDARLDKRSYNDFS